MIWNRCWRIVIPVMLFIGYQTAFAVEVAIQDKFAAVADIHFDPFSGCIKKHKPCKLLTKLKETPYQQWESIFEKYGAKHISGYYHDANYPLLKSTLSELKQITQEQQPKFALLLGDFLAHHFREDYASYSTNNSNASYQIFVKKTLQFLTYEFQKVFPKIDVYPVVGNNDTYSGDYVTVPHGEFLSDIADVWSGLIKDEDNREDFLETFPAAGYYEVTLPDHEQNKIVVLNTVLFTDRIHRNQVKHAAMMQLQWLHKKLLDAQKHHQHVLLAFHVPIGIDVFATIKNKFDIKEFWQITYTKRFEAELKQFSQTITAIFPAHIHMDTFQLIVLKQLANIPVNFTPSISPIFGNNPAFKIYSYDPQTFHLRSFEMYFYPLDAGLPTWKREYSFNSPHRPNCQQCNPETGMRQLAINNALTPYFKKYYSVENQLQELITENDGVPYYSCDINLINKIDYQTCIGQA
jgi:sphingomyelin phosphodiesterase acid-like 3